MIKINTDSIFQFVKALKRKSVPKNEIKRRLLSVDRFIKWAHQKSYLADDTFKQIQDEIAKLAIGDQRLEIGNQFPITNRQSLISNYSFGIQHYIGFAIIFVLMAMLGAGLYNQFFKKTPTPFAYSTTPLQGARVISFQGRLTDSLGNPIIAPIDITYNFYTAPSGGSPIAGSTRVCTANPDQDGVFANLIGDDSGPSCSTQLPANIFTENSEVFLGVTIGSEITEMSPRQQIANVGYAMNAETLQGLPPGTTASSIPFISAQGDLLIAASTPGIRSTYTTANFVISSAQATTIQSANGGDITFNATDGGTLRFNTFNGTLNERMTITPYGNVGISNTNPRASLDVIGDASLSGNLVFNGLTSQIRQLNGGNLSFVTSPGGDLGVSTKMTLLNNGNLGIGTTVPIYKLDVAGAASIAGNLMTGGQMQLGRFVADPTAVGSGSMYFNTTNNTIYYYNGTDWTQVGSGGGGGDNVWQRVLDGVVIPKIAADALNLGNSATASATVHLAGKTGDNSFINTGNFGIGTTGPAMKLDLGTGYSTNNSTFRTGTYELQPYALNNAFLAENAYYNGSTWTRRNAGYAEGFQFFNGQTLFFNNTSGTGSFSATYPFKTDSGNSGSVALGGNINTATGNYSGSSMVVLGTGNVGIGTTNPTKRLQIQGRASETAGTVLLGVYSSGTVGSGGSLFEAQTSGGVGLRVTELGALQMITPDVLFGGSGNTIVSFNGVGNSHEFRSYNSTQNVTDWTFNAGRYGSNNRTAGNLFAIANNDAKKVVVDIDPEELEKPGVEIDLKVNNNAKYFFKELYEK